MPPKRRGRPRKLLNGPDRSTEEIFDIISISDSSDSAVIMVEKKPVVRGTGKGKGKDTTSGIPNIYREMLAEALPLNTGISERPLKKRKVGPPNEVSSTRSGHPDDIDDEDDDDLEFEDVLGPRENIQKPQQTAYRDSDDDSGTDLEIGNFDFDENSIDEKPSGDLELTLTAKPVPQRQATIPRRKAITNVERALRLQTHKMHVLCLLSFSDRRNEWCNDPLVQNSLKPLLNQRMLTFLRPREELSQFGRAESLKRGLDGVSIMWRTKFTITARGARRSLWADDERDVQNFEMPIDAESSMENADFRAAAKTLCGSRDLGAQLFCALLRSAGVETRLVCSLQPLSFNSGGPPMPRSSAAAKTDTPETSEEEAIDINGQDSPFKTSAGSSSGSMPFTAARRISTSNASGSHTPNKSIPVYPPARPKPIRESLYPVFWVEVLDEAHQKWFPVDPLVTQTIAKPRAIEPSASDRENNMSYVVAFTEEGSARDVTRRYAKAYNAKTRKNRVESTSGGDKWWRKTMRRYCRGWKTDLEQIEDVEFTKAEEREPMPKNVADFKDHPYYALERHLKRNEILVKAHEVGKVAAGRASGTPGLKKLENIYRRRDVKIARSADAWYRIGREIEIGEQPVKTVAAKRNPHDDDPEAIEERPGTNIYSEDQTKLFEAPPIVNGLVPKNSFGNLDIFVPSMIPKGGVHIPDDEASRSARLLGIDYADALTGFEFRGRHGTAVLKGIIVAAEYAEAVEAVIEGFRDERAQAEEERRVAFALRMWKRFLVTLRIKARIDMYEIEGEDEIYNPIGDKSGDQNLQAEEEDSGMETEEYIDGGGFFPE